MQIFSITLYNLKSVHILIKNSPFVRATCGQLLKVSAPQMHSGEYAQWDNLNWTFNFKSSSSLNIDVYSV